MSQKEGTAEAQKQDEKVAQKSEPATKKPSTSKDGKISAQKEK